MRAGIASGRLAMPAVRRRGGVEQKLIYDKVAHSEAEKRHIGPFERLRKLKYDKLKNPFVS